MTIRLYAYIAGAALLCGCATRPTAALPDGKNRVQINSTAAIQAYVAQLAEERLAVDSRTFTERQLADLKVDVDGIKLKLAALQASRLAAENSASSRSAQGRSRKASTNATPSPRPLPARSLSPPISPGSEQFKPAVHTQQGNSR